MSARADAWIAAGHPATAAAAAQALRAGGNATDAVVAAGLAAGVAEPGLSSLGGGGFLTVATAAGEHLVIDGFVDTPGRGQPTADLVPHFTPVTIAFRGADQVFHVGYGSVATPGCLAGFLHAHAHLGRLPLDQVVAPARALAAEGVAVNAQQAEIFALLHATFTLTTEGRTLFTPEGRQLIEGDRFANPALADLLGEIGAGRVTGFDTPAVADPLVAAMAQGGGLLTGEDLAAYRVVDRDPLVLDAPWGRLHTNPPPSFGGTLVTRTLAATGPLHDPADPDAVAALAEILAAVGDEHAGRPPRSAKGTTHISVADHDGNRAALTTSNGSCSGVLVPGTGVQLNNIMGEADLHPGGFHAQPPGLRVGSMMAPTTLDLADGRRVALGSGGSERIRSALALTIGLLAGGASLRAAIEHPRLHWDGATLQLEPGWPDAVVRRLEQDWPINVWAEPNLYFGGVHAVATHPDGTGDAWGDPRRGGSTLRVPA